MKETHLFNLLKILKFKQPVDKLVNIGLTYSQIALLINNLVDLKFINEDLILTSIGEDEFNRLNKKNNENTLNWIQPMDECRVEKYDLFEVYLPKRKNNNPA